MASLRSLTGVLLVTGVIIAIAGCGGGGTMGGGGSGPGDATPLVRGPVTATPAGGDTLQDMPMDIEGYQLALAIWGGDIRNLRLGMSSQSIGQIAFARGPVGGNHDLFVHNLTTGLTRQITDTPYDEDEPTWVQDGALLAFQKQVGDDIDIYTSTTDGRGIRSLTNRAIPPNNDEIQPCGSYGSVIVYAADTDGDLEIYKQDADGGPVTQLTNNVAIDQMPAWSPDRDKIAWVSDVSGAADIWVMDGGGGNKFNVTSDAARDADPVWSPDGTRIAFARRIGGNWDIHVMDYTGHNLTKLTTNSAADRHPSWSPDGQRIVFSSERNGTSDIFMMDANGSAETMLLGGASDQVHPEWNAGAVFDRVFTGPSLSDGGVDPPFGSTPLQFAIVGGGSSAGTLMLGLTCGGTPSAVQVSDLNDSMYPLMVGVHVHTPDYITLLAEDVGQGKPYITHIRDSGAAPFEGNFDNVIILFAGPEGPTFGIIPWRGGSDAILPGFGDGPVAADGAGTITVTGEGLGKPGGGYCTELVLDRATLEIISSN